MSAGVRDPTGRRCGLKVKSGECVVVPWEAGGLAARERTLLPKGQAVALQAEEIVELPFARINACPATL